MALVLNGVELILRSKQQAGEHPETSEGLAPTTHSPPPKKKKDYSYISFPPTPSIPSATSRGVVIATPTPPFQRQRQEPEDEAACSFCLLCLSESTCDSVRLTCNSQSCGAGDHLMVGLTL